MRDHKEACLYFKAAARIEGSPLTPLDCRKSQLNMSRVCRSTGVFSSNLVDPRQMYGAKIKDFQHGIRADEGDHTLHFLVIKLLKSMVLWT